jgi:addiction module HigA family antidote
MRAITSPSAPKLTSESEFNAAVAEVYRICAVGDDNLTSDDIARVDALADAIEVYEALNRPAPPMSDAVRAEVDAELRRVYGPSSSRRSLSAVHPGEVLREEFLHPLGMTAYRLSKGIRVQQTRLSEVLDGKRSISADTALRLARFFGTSAEFWLRLQMRYDLETAERSADPSIAEIERYRATMA